MSLATSNDTLKTIASLRSVHGNFSEREVPEADVEQVLAASVRAASASAMQSYSIVVVRDREAQQSICGYRGSCLLAYFVDYTRSIATASRRGLDFAPADIEWFVTGSTSAVLAAQTAVIAARSLGIDSLVTNGLHRGRMERLWEMLGLPRRYCFPLVAVVLGYAAGEPAFPKGRVEGPGVVHRDTYHFLTPEETDALVQQYDDKSQHLGLVENWDESGYAHYIDWFHQEWLARSRRKGRTQMFRRLRQAGFLEQEAV